MGMQPFSNWYTMTELDYRSPGGAPRGTLDFIVRLAIDGYCLTLQDVHVQHVHWGWDFLRVVGSDSWARAVPARQRTHSEKGKAGGLFLV